MKTPSGMGLSVAASVAVSAVIGLAAFYVLRGLNAEFARSEIIAQIADKTHALQVLTAAFEEDSARSDMRQAKDVNGSLNALLENMSSREPREQVLIEHLEKNHKELGPLIDHWFEPGRAASSIDVDRREILASQIWMKAQFIADDSKRLKEISGRRILGAQRGTGGLIGVLMALLVITNGTIYFFSLKKVMRAQEALRGSEERFRVAQELSPDGFTILRPVRDEGGRVVDFTWVYENPAGARLTGKRPEELIGRPWLELLPGHRGTEFWRAYREAAETGERRIFEAPYGNEPAGPRWFRIAAVPVGGDLAVLAQDITQQKEFQAELQRQVAERTSKLQDLVGELEHFSYTITHDLKSPLRAMRGFAEMAREAVGQSDATPFLEKIATSAERMDRLIADALSYSRSVRQELPLEDVDAGALLRGMLDTYPELQPDKARIVVEGRLPVVLANEAGLTQVFSNLLGNAVKFVKGGEKPDVRVYAKRSGGWVRIWVEDKGIGVSPAMLPRVFDMFSRGSKDYEGTGIGLALVRKVGQRMGGRVGAESEEGKGSRFWIELKSGEGPALAKAASVVEATADKVAGTTVLYVEDEESDAVFMQRAFHGKGLAENLRVVGDGRAAIQYLSGAGDYSDRKKYPLPELVLLDLNLPHVPGFEVLRWMRNHPDFAKTPVVVFSSSTREDDRAKARELGANEFVSKPNSGLKFEAVVEGLRGKWLRGAQARVLDAHTSSTG